MRLGESGYPSSFTQLTSTRYHINLHLSTPLFIILSSFFFTYFIIPIFIILSSVFIILLIYSLIILLINHFVTLPSLYDKKIA